MTQDSSGQDPQPSSQGLGWVVVMIGVFTLCGLAIADFLNDGEVHEFFIWAIVFMICTFGGYTTDKVVDAMRKWKR